MTNAAVSDHRPIHLFEAFGVELEYMIVGRETLDVLPVTDEVLRQVAGEYVSDVDFGDVSWSNELVLHVIEIKTGGPAPRLEPLPDSFQRSVQKINELLLPLGGRLMPSATHPWMDPFREMRLWPHEYSPVYEAYDRIFDCRGHGWANLQSVHLNLPFSGDDEFGRLHAAIRLLLPIMPALAASSPVIDGRLTGLMDSRLEVYRTNSQKIPSLTAEVIPEPVYTRDEYDRRIFARIYADIAPFDPDGTLQDEFLNSRGAIARFGRGTIEIRVLDVQECPAADVAVCAAIVETLRALVAERWTSTEEQQRFDTARLASIFRDGIRHADETLIADADYLRQFGLPGNRTTARELWQHLVAATQPNLAGSSLPWAEPLHSILAHGPLARRITRCLAGDTSAARLAAVYGELCDCLAAGRMFRGCA